MSLMRVTCYWASILIPEKLDCCSYWLNRWKSSNTAVHSKKESTSEHLFLCFRMSQIGDLCQHLEGSNALSINENWTLIFFVYFNSNWMLSNVFLSFELWIVCYVSSQWSVTNPSQTTVLACDWLKQLCWFVSLSGLLIL